MNLRISMPWKLKKKGKQQSNSGRWLQQPQILPNPVASAFEIRLFSFPIKGWNPSLLESGLGRVTCFGQWVRPPSVMNTPTSSRLR